LIFSSRDFERRVILPNPGKSTIKTSLTNCTGDIRNVVPAFLPTGRLERVKKFITVVLPALGRPVTGI
jgi:hypothetical protein